jgi:hypothetical protein
MDGILMHIYKGLYDGKYGTNVQHWMMPSLN